LFDVHFLKFAAYRHPFHLLADLRKTYSKTTTTTVPCQALHLSAVSQRYLLHKTKAKTNPTIAFAGAWQSIKRFKYPLTLIDWYANAAVTNINFYFPKCYAQSDIDCMVIAIASGIFQQIAE
jgi:hypothetical protein